MVASSASVQFGWLNHMWLICSTKALYSFGVAESFSYSFPARSMKAAKVGFFFYVVLHSGRDGIGRECKDFTDPVGMAHRHVERDDAAVTPSHDVGARNFQDVEKADDIIGHQVIPIGLSIARAAPMPPAVHQNDPMRRRQSSHLVAPIIGIGQTSVKQHDRRAIADRGVKELDAVEPPPCR